MLPISTESVEGNDEGLTECVGVAEVSWSLCCMAPSLSWLSRLPSTPSQTLSAMRRARRLHCRR